MNYVFISHTAVTSMLGVSVDIFSTLLVCILITYTYFAYQTSVSQAKTKRISMNTLQRK